ncbi:hypothetical protein RRG08_030626 [Elysia crispata]|uniref:WSC domain-containing protein n=1 Tax=Elysia crispata TaxID=231223 RepID=A0AAE0Y2N5_9GAST|nr:hypothetical protein RRG08_030626 [Elysia crispata]
MLRNVLFCAVLVIAVVVTAAQTPIKKNCRTSVPGYDCGQTCIAFFVGCYHSNGPTQILPKNSLVNLRHTIDWQKWMQDGSAGDLIKKCAQLAVQKNMKYFGIEYYGECYFGNTLNQSQPKVTTEDDCTKYCGFDVGGASAMVVYEVFTPPSK